MNRNSEEDYGTYAPCTDVVKCRYYKHIYVVDSSSYYSVLSGNSDGALKIIGQIFEFYIVVV